MKIKVETDLVKRIIIETAIKEECIAEDVKVSLDTIVFDEAVIIDTPAIVREYLIGTSLEPFDFDLEIPPRLIRLPFDDGIKMPSIAEQLKELLNEDSCNAETH